MGFADRFRKSWDLAKASYAVLRSDTRLLVFPLVSGVAVVLLAIIFFVPAFLTGLLYDSSTDSVNIAGYVLTFVFYVISYTIIIGSQTALVGCAMLRMGGGQPTVRDGFDIAKRRAPAIIGYAVISATIGVILQAIRERSGMLGVIVAGFIGGAWSLVTFLVVPVLVVEDVSPIEAIKRSGGLLKRTWGEQVIGNGAISLVFGLITVAVVVVAGLIVTGLNQVLGTAGLVIGVILAVSVVAAITLFATALSGIYTAALYRYAVGENTGGYYDENTFKTAFAPKS